MFAATGVVHRLQLHFIFQHFMFHTAITALVWYLVWRSRRAPRAGGRAGAALLTEPSGAQADMASVNDELKQLMRARVRLLLNRHFTPQNYR